ncbi:unnamed protein product, partial [Chrysoparadoxa australica]
RDSWLRTPLHRAAKEGHLEIARLLVEKGAEVNAKGDAEWTPLHCSSFHGNLEVVQLLLNVGANTTLMDHKGRTPEVVAHMSL